jgi:hypothetical protein
MKNLIIIIILIFVQKSVDGQLKIGNNPKSINSNSILEIESSNKGLLFPRLALTNTMLSNPLSAHVLGMTVYNTNKI